MHGKIIVKETVSKFSDEARDRAYAQLTFGPKIVIPIKARYFNAPIELINTDEIHARVVFLLYQEFFVKDPIYCYIKTEKIKGGLFIETSLTKSMEKLNTSGVVFHHYAEPAQKGYYKYVLIGVMVPFITGGISE